MKNLVFILFLTFSISAFAQKEQTVTLTQIGQGKTKDAAKYNALRNAIEKAFGTFISANTTLLNDELIKDEIVSVSSGNIQNFEILSETQMPDGSYSSVVKAMVSIGKLTSFCESKGIAVEFKGGLFAANIKLQKLYKENEESIITNLASIINDIAKKSYDISLSAEEPILEEEYGRNRKEVAIVPVSVILKPNKNIKLLVKLLIETLTNISLKNDQAQNFNKYNIPYYSIVVDETKYYFRSEKTGSKIIKLCYYEIPKSTTLFSISNGLYNTTCCEIIGCNRETIARTYEQTDEHNQSLGWTKGSRGRGQIETKMEGIDLIRERSKDYDYRLFEPWIIRKLIERKELGGDIDFLSNIIFNRGEWYSQDFACPVSCYINTNFVYNLDNYLSMEEISYIKEYTITPIK